MFHDRVDAARVARSSIACSGIDAANVPSIR